MLVQDEHFGPGRVPWEGTEAPSCASDLQDPAHIDANARHAP
jgi:hypothetical protein